MSCPALLIVSRGDIVIVRDGFCFSVREEVVDRSSVFGILAVQSLSAGNTMTDWRQTDLIILNRQNDLGISVQTHGFANRSGQDHAAVARHLNINGLAGHSDTPP
jgi:hypothetical protein